MVCEPAVQQFLPFAEPCLLLIDAWMFCKYPIFVNQVSPKVQGSVLDMLPSVASALPFFSYTEFGTGLS